MRARALSTLKRRAHLLQRINELKLTGAATANAAAAGLQLLFQHDEQHSKYAESWRCGKHAGAAHTLRMNSEGQSVCRWRKRLGSPVTLYRTLVG